MKKNYIIFLLVILFSGFTFAQEPQKNFINYQGVARNGADQLMANETMTIGIALKMGSASGAAAYAENHSVTTDANGVFRLKIGNGNVVSGVYTAIPWGSEAIFATVLVNGSEIGTTEMMAVPYALSSGDGAQTATEVPYDNGVSGLAATNAQEAIDELVGSGAVDADADPTNELQDISLTGTDLTISEGSTIDLSAIVPPGGTDDQNAAEVPFDNAASGLVATDTQTAIEELASGGLVDTDDQDLSLSGTLLQITDGAGVDLGPLIPAGGTDDQNADEVPYDNTVSGLAAADTQAAIDELATAGLVDTDDQNLTFNAITNILEIEDGNTVDLSGLASGGSGSSLWAENGSSINYSSGNVGIGIANPVSLQHVHTSSDLSETRYTTELTGDGINDGLVVHMAHTPVGPLAGINNYEDGPLLLGTNGTNRLFITANGNISIGGLEPTAKLDVEGDIRSRDLEGTGERNVVADADGNLVIGAGGGGSSLWSENGDNIYFNPGNVGIGTDDPEAPLDIALQSFISINTTSATATNYMQFNNSTGAVGYSGVWSNERDMDFGTNGSNRDGKVHLVTGADPKLTVAPDGNVGIGTEIPTAKLEVDGDIKTSGEVHGPTTGQANMIPIAYGKIRIDGSIISGSGNYTVSGTGGFKSIIIDGQTFDEASSTIVVATLRSFDPGFIRSSSGFHEALPSVFIETFDISGATVGMAFSFVAYKP